MNAPILDTSRRSRRGAVRILAIPALLFGATLAGLALGLIGDGSLDIAAWLLLSLPILAGLRAGRRRN